MSSDHYGMPILFVLLGALCLFAVIGIIFFVVYKGWSQKNNSLKNSNRKPQDPH